MEREDEIAGVGNSYTAMFWEYDSRTARRWNLDPRPNSSISSYGTFALNPVMFSDVMGDTVTIENGGEKVFYRDKQLYNMDGSKYEGENAYIRAVEKDLNSIADTDNAKNIETLVNSDLHHNITMPKDLAPSSNGGNFCGVTKDDYKRAEAGIRVKTSIGYDPNNKKPGNYQDLPDREPEDGLAHEIAHSVDYNNGTYTTKITPNEIRYAEVNAMNAENIMREKNGEPLRNKYNDNDDLPAGLIHILPGHFRGVRTFTLPQPNNIERKDNVNVKPLQVRIDKYTGRIY